MNFKRRWGGSSTQHFNTEEGPKIIFHKCLLWFDFFKGSFASLTAVFSFRRRTESFISSIFVPSIVLVVLSWCCFYISPAAVPARVALSITTILTSILLKGNVNRDMPKVSYMKAVDYFMLTSFGFIFAALIEYIIVLNSDPVLPSWCKRGQKMDEKQKFTVVSEVSKEKSGLIKKNRRNIAPREYFFSREDI